MRTTLLLFLTLVISISVAAENGDTFVDFDGVDIDSNPVKLSDYVGKGNYVLMEFWASWCGPCKQALPVLKEIYRDYGPKGLVMVSVDCSERRIGDGIASARKEGICWNTIFSKKMTPADLYDVKYIPRAFLFDPEGKLIAKDLPISALPELLETTYKEK